MIKEIILKDYRCFHDSKMRFKDLTVIVGKNNAGKSSLIEALRMIAYASRKALKNSFHEPPYGFDIPIGEKGIHIDTDKLKIDLRGIVHMYSERIASVRVTFDNGCQILILCNKDNAFARLYDKQGKIIKNKNNAIAGGFGNVGILPQIGLIKENEKMLTKETVMDDRETYLSSRHFRNEIWLYKDEYLKKFRRMAQKSWEGLEIKELNYDPLGSGYITLMVKDAGFPGELGIMGSGLQMWLQIIWFLCRAEGYETIILDEPDVYMHPDLQRKLLHLAERQYKQVIIATHSVEIISEVAPENIVMIDKNKRTMSYANKLGAVQQIIDNIGGIQNISLIRLGFRKKILFGEGEDIKILSKIYGSLYPENENAISTLPYVALKGFANLREAYGASKLLASETKGAISACCILDRDYYTMEFLDKKRREAKENNLQLHIWNKKEIENYILVPRVIFRITGEPKEKYSEFLEKLELLVEQNRGNVTGKIADMVGFLDSSLAASTAFKKATDYMEAHWTSLEAKMSMVGGKKLVEQINQWIRSEYGKSCSLARMIKELTLEDVDRELIDVLNWLV